jgi:hypothetical protein
MRGVTIKFPERPRNLTVTPRILKDRIETSQSIYLILRLNVTTGARKMTAGMVTGYIHPNIISYFLWAKNYDVLRVSLLASSAECLY